VTSDHRHLPDQEAVRRLYDSAASWHDAVGVLSMPRRHEALRALGAQPGDRVLDLACGGGLNLAALVAQTQEQGRIVGMDDSPGMLRHAAQRIARGGWRNVRLVRADASRLPFPDGAFDRILCTYALKVIPPYREALEEAARVLKPGGRFVVLDGKPSDGPTRFLNRLATWIASGPMSELGRPVIQEMRLRFPDVQVMEYDSGHTFVAVATKGGGAPPLECEGLPSHSSAEAATRNLAHHHRPSGSSQRRGSGRPPGVETPGYPSQAG
jgi:ubiquinone/menaquinone biosynthesis C-methylase UbiE